MDKPLTMERWPGERHTHHRALLLYAMQAPSLRSGRAVGKAVGISEATARNWKKKSKWDARLSTYDHEETDEIALSMYRRLYMMDYGEAELPQVAKNILRPLGAHTLKDEGAMAAHEATKRAQNAVGDSMHAVEQVTARAVADNRRDARKDAERHIRLIDASLGLIARKLKADELRVNVRDIPLLIESRDRLFNVVSGNTGSGAPVVESARVKQARELGTDLIEALHEDALEMVVILGALRQAGPVESGDVNQNDKELVGG